MKDVNYTDNQLTKGSSVLNISTSNAYQKCDIFGGANFEILLTKARQAVAASFDIVLLPHKGAQRYQSVWRLRLRRCEGEDSFEAGKAISTNCFIQLQLLSEILVEGLELTIDGEMLGNAVVKRPTGGKLLILLFSFHLLNFLNAIKSGRRNNPIGNGIFRMGSFSGESANICLI
ncbi:hypothetical protein TNIN_475871 [Trichonephila inaurata madagascariensis]|uniref:Uncharacterized protein n=1 Tax=Trichonephila inaurata madagascariensis TaxID=2747483 RepID=A0A8X7BYK9_9ARAC|nr:hypothetical protein TNIN_475871 [Trichonephila inaurata madagascariensis]